MVLHARVITGSGGGPDKTILNSPRYLSRHGYRCACAFLCPPGDAGFSVIRERAANWQAPLEEVVDRGPLDWQVVPQLLKICRQFGVTIWHAHDYKTNLLGLLIRRRHPMHLVTTVHGWVERTHRTKLYYLVDRWSLPRYEKVICVSEDLLQTCRRYGVASERSLLIENAIDIEQFSRSRSVAVAKAELGWPVARYRIGAVGRLSAEKAFDVLIRAVADITKRGFDVGLVIAGDGPEKESLLQLVAELGLQNRVELAGFQHDLRPFYESLDLLVLSSLREGLPNVLLEAMSLKVPVVASRIAGIPRLVNDGENGLLVEAGVPAALADVIAKALGNMDLRQRMAEAGRRSIEEHYSFDVRMQKVAALYDEVLKSRSAKGSANA
jgi:glycosyltransferase involved in cell wall biosynthesis